MIYENLQNAPYSDELKVLNFIAHKLGGPYLHSFYSNASRSVLSPYILHQFATDSAR